MESNNFITNFAASTAINYLFPALTCLYSRLNGAAKNYDGYEIIRVNLNTPRSYDVVKNIFLTQSFDFMVPPTRNGTTEVMVCPEQLRGFKLMLQAFNMPFETIVHNVQHKIESERVHNQDMIIQSRTSALTWTSYHRLSTIHQWMDGLAEKYPDMVSVQTYGRSTEGRALKVMKISKPSSVRNSTGKPAVWIDGGIHAREWISPATVTFIGNQLLEGAVRGDTELIDSFDWYIMPSMNPDGYEYSHTKDRMWRKTRSGGGFLADAFDCKGVDPNRNWDFKWGGKGTSSNPCTQIYRGPHPASEPEVAATQRFLYDHRNEIKLFLTFHSYSQMIMTPWGYDHVDLEDKGDLMKIAQMGAKALSQVHGTEYQTGASPDLLYPAAGGSEDYARGVAGIKFAYCVELRDTGRYGFMLPADQIIPVGEETFAAVKAMALGVRDFYADPKNQEQSKVRIFPKL